MLIRRAELAAIERGEVKLAFRRWPRPRVRRGTLLRTAVGLLSVVSLDEVKPDEITEADAHAAGLASRAALLAFLRARPAGHIYRIGLRHAGPDPRVALRQRARITRGDLDGLVERLARMDPAAPGIGWPMAYLELIAGAPGVRAAILADGLGLETQAFKRRVRRLKELGLTESLRPGYRLSPRGEALLEALRRSQPTR